MTCIQFFSVVIPVYNKGPHIYRSISSVLNQTYQNFELILVNDASTDNSLEEIQKFTDERIRLFHRTEPGPGGYASRNLGIEKAKGEWVAFLDADDEWYLEHLQKLCKLIKDFPNENVLCGGWENYYLSRCYYSQFFDPYFVEYSEKGNHRLSFNDYLKAEVAYLRPICTSTACIKRKLLLDSGAFPNGIMKRGGDVDTWLRCIEKAGGLAWSAHIGAIYYRDSINMVTKTAWSDASEQRKTVNKLLGQYSGHTAVLLKKFANRRTLSAWKFNHHIEGKRNFVLLGKLYLSVDIILNMLYIPLSFLPSSIFFRLNRIKNFLRKLLTS